MATIHTPTNTLEVLHNGVVFLTGSWESDPGTYGGMFAGTYADGRPARTGLALEVPGRSFRLAA